MSYTLGAHSRSELKDVHPDLVRVVERAIEITQQDFQVFDGIRTEAEQREYVARGVSQTMKSLHLPQDDGFGHAVDLVPFINGKVRWEEPPGLQVARAMHQASRELRVKVRWGGGWTRLDDDRRDPGLILEEYISRRRRQGRKPFVDLPHFELME